MVPPVPPGLSAPPLDIPSGSEGDAPWVVPWPWVLLPPCGLWPFASVTAGHKASRKDAEIPATMVNGRMMMSPEVRMTGSGLVHAGRLPQTRNLDHGTFYVRQKVSPLTGTHQALCTLI